MTKCMRVAVVQMNSGQDKQVNFARASRLLARARQQDARWAVLPENFSFMAGDDESRALLAENFDHSETMEWLRDQARSLGMGLIAGGVLLRLKGWQKPRNISCVINAEGQCVARYAKMHLFDADVDGGCYRESDAIEAGDEPCIVDLDGMLAGLSICYDLRFPELYRYYASRHCHVFVVTAAFTEETGAAHWHVLVRARAIENQCYVLASAQQGEHPGGRRTHGHSMIVDPWGVVLAECACAGEDIAVADIDMACLDRVRQRLPVLRHRRLC